MINTGHKILQACLIDLITQLFVFISVQSAVYPTLLYLSMVVNIADDFSLFLIKP